MGVAARSSGRVARIPIQRSACNLLRGVATGSRTAPMGRQRTGLLGVDTPSYHTGSEIRPARALMSHRWASLQLQLSSDITQGGTLKCTSGGPAHLILRSSKTRAHRVVPRARRTPAKSDRLRRRRATAQLPRTTLVRTGHASLAYPQDEQYNQAQC